MFFYASLTLAKISLLLLYRRLLDRTPTIYTIIWWSILVFCLLVHTQLQNQRKSLADVLKSFIGSSMTTVFVCDNQEAKYNQGVCAKPNEQKRAQFSLWFAYAVDVATDLTGTYMTFQRLFCFIC